MRKKVFLTMIIGASLWAMDWSRYALEVLGETNRSGSPVVILRDGRGMVFSVENATLFGEERIPTLLQIKDVMASWTRIVPERLSFVVTESGLEILYVPKVVMYRGRNLSSFIPAGMRFSWRLGLLYDFRMVIETNLVRIRGTYESEEELLSRMYRAVMYPTLYMRSEDMDMLLQKVENIDEGQVILKAENMNLKKLWLAYLNRNLFGQLRPIADEKIEKVVALKKNNPYLDRRDIYTTLRAEGMKISQKEVDLILLVYFAEY